MADDMPENPFSQLAQAAMSLHELFTSYLDAGFSERQALYLVACLMTGGPKGEQ